MGKCKKITIKDIAITVLCVLVLCLSFLSFNLWKTNQSYPVGEVIYDGTDKSTGSHVVITKYELENGFSVATTCVDGVLKTFTAYSAKTKDVCSVSAEPLDLPKF